MAEGLVGGWLENRKVPFPGGLFEGHVIEVDPDKRGVWIRVTNMQGLNGHPVVARARIGKDGAAGLAVIIERLKPDALVKGTAEADEFEFPQVTSIALE